MCKKNNNRNESLGLWGKKGGKSKERKRERNVRERAGERQRNGRGNESQ